MATFIDVVLPRSDRRRVPKRLTTRIDYAVASDAPFRALLGSTTVRRTSRVDGRRPIEVAAPLRGSGWLVGNACCGDPSSPHRNLLLATDHGRYVTWPTTPRSRLPCRRGTESSRSPYGGSNCQLCHGLPGPRLPPVVNLANALGNNVVVDIGHGRFAFYAHMQPNSIIVQEGRECSGDR